MRLILLPFVAHLYTHLYKVPHPIVWLWGFKGQFGGGGREHRRHVPSIFFVKIGWLTLCGCLRQEIIAPNRANWPWYYIFLHFWGGTSPSGCKVLSVLNLGAPSLKNPWSAPVYGTGSYIFKQKLPILWFFNFCLNAQPCCLLFTFYIPGINLASLQSQYFIQLNQL